MTDREISEEKPCGVPWCNKLAYPGSDWCQFHEVVNPFDDQEPPKPVVQLALLHREAPDYWFRDPNTGEIDTDAVHGVYVFDENALFDFLEACELPDLRDAT